MFRATPGYPPGINEQIHLRNDDGLEVSSDRTPKCSPNDEDDRDENCFSGRDHDGGVRDLLAERMVYRIGQNSARDENSRQIDHEEGNRRQVGAYEENPATHQMVPKVPREQECHGRREMKDDYTEGEFHA